MSILTIDTLQIAEELKSNDFTAKQAKALASVIREVQEASSSNFVTDSKLQEEMLKLKIFVLTAMLANSALVIGLLKLI